MPADQTPAPLVIDGVDGLRDRVGQELGVSAWLSVDQDLIRRFADVTGDDQFIHVDPERAAATPFGGTIAHGLFTLSLGPALTFAMYDVAGIAMAINYGYERVRFPAPLPVGSRVRMRAELVAVDEVPGAAQVTVRQTFEREGEAKPVCVADSVTRYVFA